MLSGGNIESFEREKEKVFRERNSSKKQLSYSEVCLIQQVALNVAETVNVRKIESDTYL